MRMLLVIIQPTKLNAVRDSLRSIGVERLTVCDALGYARQHGPAATYHGIEYQTDFLRKVMLEIVVNDDFVDRTIETITTVARTGTAGNHGDGKVFLLPMVEAITIDQNLRGESAV